MNSVLITYTPKFELDFAPEYVWTKCKKCFNLKSGRQIKQVYCGGSIGYVIRGKFYSLSRLKNHLRKIEKENLPF